MNTISSFSFSISSHLVSCVFMCAVLRVVWHPVLCYKISHCQLDYSLFCWLKLATDGSHISLECFGKRQEKHSGGKLNRDRERKTNWIKSDQKRTASKNSVQWKFKHAFIFKTEIEKWMRVRMPFDLFLKRQQKRKKKKKKIKKKHTLSDCIRPTITLRTKTDDRRITMPRFIEEL